MALNRNPKQTVRQAIDAETGELVEASALSQLTEDAFTALRRRTMEARVARKRRGENRACLVCACCKQPLYLSRHHKNGGNRWFVHDGRTPEDCVYHEGTRNSEEITRALIYRGQQEGESHRKLKLFVAEWLRRDPDVQQVDVELTKFSAVAAGEWRRPDVRCVYKGVPIVFELQLSYTFLSTVIERDEFYQREREFIIWVFPSFDRSRATVTDEAFFNRRNLFVLDAEAQQATLVRGLLTFSGYHQEPRIVRDSIEDTWINTLVGLREAHFPPYTYRPYYFDYPAARKSLEAERRRRADEASASHWNSLVDRYIVAALDYYANDHSDAFITPMLQVVVEMEWHSQWRASYATLKDPVFFGHHSLLAVLLTMARNKVVSYSVPTVYQVLDAALRSSGHDLFRPHTILLLRAFKKWKPPVKEEQREKLRKLAHEVHTSVLSGEGKFRRFTGYDEAVALLFPELADAVRDEFGAAQTSARQATYMAERIAFLEERHTHKLDREELEP